MLLRQGAHDARGHFHLQMSGSSPERRDHKHADAPFGSLTQAIPKRLGQGCLGDRLLARTDHDVDKKVAAKISPRCDHSTTNREVSESPESPEHVVSGTIPESPIDGRAGLQVCSY